METRAFHRATAETLALYRAALDWDLVDPIVIESQADFKSEHRWGNKVQPYYHQVTNLITFCRRLPVTLLADDVGLGKTISAGLVASELISRSRVRKILIVCPKLLGHQWREELDSKFGIPAKIAIGAELVEADLEEDVGAVITTYHSARSYLESIPEDRFEMLILDEAHKLRNLYGVPQPPQVAKRFQKALEDRRFRYVLMLTATPIHNRLWDLYSLVDLLATARGHPNPFGSEGSFARRFIADNVADARHLKPDARDEFRSIVYGYMSRVRRADAELQFPERIVQLHRVKPTEEELQLISVLAKPIQKLNRLSQIGLLQALTSSPHALSRQLDNMAANGTAPAELAAEVRAIVARMPTISKLQGLATLVDNLVAERPEDWRLLVFTTRRETQTTIQIFFEERGISVGIINGSTGSRNQETITRFKKSPPECHVIITTEAGSEGLNLQAANVLVNFDLPWNPMIVEQRIGRVQRLASKHATVCICNMILGGTFEEHIVVRLLEKLQLASHAIGDIEALLEGTGIDADDEDESAGFVEKIRKLVVDALAGVDVMEAVKKADESIQAALNTLESERSNIDSMLGGMDGNAYTGPPAPKLPHRDPSMSSQDFALAALRHLGAIVTPQGNEIYISEHEGKRELIRLEPTEGTTDGAVLYAPGTPAFSRLVSRILATAPYLLDDLNGPPLRVRTNAARTAAKWVLGFGGSPRKAKMENTRLCFEGTALARTRATVAHDSYERLVEIPCRPTQHNVVFNKATLEPIPDALERPSSIGITLDALSDAALTDVGIAEFRRFYEARQEEETAAAGDDQRKQAKLREDFTPRIGSELVAFDGKLHRELQLHVHYRFNSDFDYRSHITVRPHTGEIIAQPRFVTCAKTGARAPEDCLERCAITEVEVLRHLLFASDISGRKALPEHTVVCSLSGKRILLDEAETSAVSGQLATNSLLETSALSGKRAEARYFGECEFSGSRVLSTELATSQVSGKRYRVDEEARSIVSGKTGHKGEFVICSETNQRLLPAEAGKCEVTGKIVAPGLLDRCAVSGKRVLPVVLDRCAVTGKKALKTFFVTSSLSGVRLLEEEAIRSVTGEFCAPLEAQQCTWQGQLCHPHDLKVCELTGLRFHFRFMMSDSMDRNVSNVSQIRLRPLVELLNGTRRTTDSRELWDEISERASDEIRGKCAVEAAQCSPDGRHIAVCLEVRSMLGLRTNHAGLLYSLADQAITGRIAFGKRSTTGWDPSAVD